MRKHLNYELREEINEMVVFLMLILAFVAVLAGIAFYFHIRSRRSYLVLDEEVENVNKKYRVSEECKFCFISRVDQIKS